MSGSVDPEFNLGVTACECHLGLTAVTGIGHVYIDLSVNTVY